MSAPPRTQDARITSVWVATCLLTLVSAGAAAGFGHGQAARTGLSLAVLAIGAAKAALVLRDFMELRTAPRWLRWFGAVWLIALFATIVALYLG